MEVTSNSDTLRQRERYRRRELAKVSRIVSRAFLIQIHIFLGSAA